MVRVVLHVLRRSDIARVRNEAQPNRCRFLWRSAASRGHLGRSSVPFSCPILVRVRMEIPVFSRPAHALRGETLVAELSSSRGGVLKGTECVGKFMETAEILARRPTAAGRDAEPPTPLMFITSECDPTALSLRQGWQSTSWYRFCVLCVPVQNQK